MSALPQDQAPVDPASLPASSHLLASLEPVLDFMSDGILIIRGDRSIAYANDAFMRLWRVRSEMMTHRNDFAILNHVLSQLSDPTQFVGEIERLYLSQEVSADQLSFKDGRLFARRSLPLDIGDDKTARVWIFADITPEQAPAAAASTHDELRGGPAGLLRRLSRQMAGK